MAPMDNINGQQTDHEQRSKSGWKSFQSHHWKIVFPQERALLINIPQGISELDMKG